MGKILCTTLLLLLSLSSPSYAQYYNIHTWESFENGMIPQTLVYGHNADPSTIHVFPFGIDGTPGEMMTEVASFECGRYGVSFFPTSSRKFLSVYSPVSLDRSRLGTKGHALYQADFFLPAKGTPIPNVALLAAAGSGGTIQPAMYRFGILDGGEKVYFSFLDDPQKPPPVYVEQRIDELNLTRPGWHRFQIIFKGQEEISCCIDRVPTAFSPVRNTRLTSLNAGIMVAIKEVPRSVVADNLSIQWSPEEVPLPDSPWIRRNIQKDANLFAEGSPLPWFTNPSQAWMVSSSQKRPLLVMFYSPKIAPYEYLLGVTPNNQATHNLLQRHVLARVDANQLWGSALAQKMNVVRIPTLMVLGPDGRELSRAEVLRGQTQWPDLAKTLWKGGPMATGQ